MPEFSHTPVAAAWVAVAISTAAVIADFTQRYFNDQTKAAVTAVDVISLGGQVGDLKLAVKELTTQLQVVPRATDIAALTARADKQDALIAEIKQTADVVRADVNNMMRPPMYLNPR